MIPAGRRTAAAARHLAGRHAIVTGAASGIGRATAQRLAELGADVTVHDLRLQPAVAAAREIAQATGVRTAAVRADVAREAEMARAFARAVEVLGPVAILVNNAGIMPPRVGPAHRISIDDFDRMLAIHLRGAFLACRLVVEDMRRERFGRIVNLSSVLGLVGLPYRVAYQIAKTGLIGFTRTLALENARYGITVNAVAPGYILTDTLRARAQAGLINHDLYAERTPVGRWGRAEEVARLVGFLAEPASGFLTAAVYPVDGGFSARGDPGEDIGRRPPSPFARRPRKRARRATT